LSLDLKTQMLCHGNDIFMNGEAIPNVGDNYSLLRELADRRELSALTFSKEARFHKLPGELPEELPEELSGNLIELLYQWYLDGFLNPL